MQTDQMGPRQLLEWLTKCEARDEIHAVIGSWLRANPPWPGEIADARATALPTPGARERLDMVLTQATAVLGSVTAAQDWVTRPQIGLDGRRPIDLLTTGTVVEDLLQRMEAGVYV